jgi:hypothetical protein
VTRGGTVEGEVSAKFAEDLFRFVEPKGAYIRLDGNPDKRHELLPAFNDIEEFCQAVPWRVVRSKPFSSHRHINIQELRELLRDLRYLSVTTFSPGRFLDGGDSNVVLGCWTKGRSPSLEINPLLRVGGALSVFSRKQIFPFRLGTKANPSDDPSREAPLREPTNPKPWMREHLETKAGTPLLDDPRAGEHLNSWGLEHSGGACPPPSKRWTLIIGEDEFELGPALTLDGRRTFAHWKWPRNAGLSVSQRRQLDSLLSERIVGLIIVTVPPEASPASVEFLLPLLGTVEIYRAEMMVLEQDRSRLAGPLSILPERHNHRQVTLAILENRDTPSQEIDICPRCHSVCNVNHHQCLPEHLNVKPHLVINRPNLWTVAFDSILPSSVNCKHIKHSLANDAVPQEEFVNILEVKPQLDSIEPRSNSQRPLSIIINLSSPRFRSHLSSTWFWVPNKGCLIKLLRRCLLRDKGSGRHGPPPTR